MISLGALEMLKKHKESRLSLSELQKQQNRGLKLGEFVKVDIPMEED